MALVIDSVICKADKALTSWLTRPFDESVSRYPGGIYASWNVYDGRGFCIFTSPLVPLLKAKLFRVDLKVNRSHGRFKVYVSLRVQKPFSVDEQGTKRIYFGVPSSPNGDSMGILSILGSDPNSVHALRKLRVAVQAKVKLRSRLGAL